MTIAVIWREDNFQFCAADTRLTVDNDATPTTDVASKLFTIPVSVHAFGDDGFLRQPHYRMKYGFVYAGAASPAAMTAVTASTLLQSLACPGGRTDPPRFEEIAKFVCRLSKVFMSERIRPGNDPTFSAGFFGWCPHEMAYKVAHINGRNDAGGFRVELTFPEAPSNDGDPWLVIGGGKAAFHSKLADYRKREQHITKRIPRRVIDEMIDEETDRSVGGATSIGYSNQNGFELCYAVEPINKGQPQARRVFNGLDLDTEIGHLEQYFVAMVGVA